LQVLSVHEQRLALDGGSDEVALLIAQAHCNIGLVFLRQAALTLPSGGAPKATTDTQQSPDSALSLRRSVVRAA
jgi:hypothetical protein